MKKYDNYDYEEAFKKYIDDTEEERLEKLLREGKVNCLYRTATTKCTNIKSQTTLLEARIYPSYPRLSDMPKTKKRPSSKAQRNLNDKNARRYLIRLANINFGKGDLWCTFGWNDDKLPADEERARKDIKNFIASSAFFKEVFIFHHRSPYPEVWLVSTVYTYCHSTMLIHCSKRKLFHSHISQNIF